MSVDRCSVVNIKAIGAAKQLTTLQLSICKVYCVDSISLLRLADRIRVSISQKPLWQFLRSRNKGRNSVYF